MTTTVYNLKLAASAGDSTLDLTVDEQGEGRPVLLLHGGGGPGTVAGFAALLAGSRPARVITPVHPGFGGTPRPETLDTVAGLAELYMALLDELGLDDVTVVGNSIGGWIAAEMALLASPRVSEIILVNGVGIVVPGHPIADFFSLTMAQVAQLSYHDPDRFGIDPAKLPPAAQAAMAGNRATLAVYSGTAMNDPTLAGRLAAVRTPVRVLWGDSDQIVDPEYGRAFANAISAPFQLLTDTGHMPQLETPDQLLEAIWAA